MKTLNISIIHVNVELYVKTGLHYAVERLVFHIVVTVDNVVVDDGVLLLRHLYFCEMEVWSALPQVNEKLQPSKHRGKLHIPNGKRTVLHFEVLQ